MIYLNYHLHRRAIISHSSALSTTAQYGLRQN